MGHILGNAVCVHHKYGPIPAGIDYLKVRDVVLAKPQIEISIGDALTGSKTFGIEYEYMTAASAADYHRALGFALSVLSRLNEQLQAEPDSHTAPRFFEPSDELALRNDSK